MASTEVERRAGRNGVDVEDVPSAEWGWSGENYKALHIGGILAALLLISLIHGNHTGRIEDLFLIGFAAIILFLVGRDWWLRRRGWIR